MFKKEIAPLLPNLFQNTEEGALPSSFYEGSILLIPKPDKEELKNNNNNYRLIFLMNIGV